MFESELILQSITQSNLDLFGLEFVASEIQLDGLRFDTLAFDKKADSFAIIEYKNEFSPDVLKQGEDYYNLLLDNKDFYIDRYNEVFEGNLDDVDGARVLIIGPKFSEEQIQKTKSPDYPFELWKVTLMDDSCIVYRQAITNETRKLNVSKDQLKLTQEGLLENRPKEITDLYFTLKDRVLCEFDDVDLKILIDAFSFSMDNDLICVVKFLKSSFNVYFYTGHLEDDLNMLRDISDMASYGNANYELKLGIGDDLDYFMNLFKQCRNQKEVKNV